MIRKDNSVGSCATEQDVSYMAKRDVWRK